MALDTVRRVISGDANGVVAGNEGRVGQIDGQSNALALGRPGFSIGSQQTVVDLDQKLANPATVVFISTGNLWVAAL